MSYGIDVSHYQGLIDWNAVFNGSPQYGPCTWVAMKATEGVANPSNPDPAKRGFDQRFTYNRQEVRKHISEYLIYHFVSLSSAQAQFNNFVHTVGDLQDGEGIMLDAENNSLTIAEIVALAEMLEAHYGRPVAVYVGAFTAQGRLWHSPEIFNGYRPRIFPAYTDLAHAQRYASPYPWDVWQFTGAGSWPGINGYLVDIDYIANPGAFDHVYHATVQPVPPDPIPIPPLPTNPSQTFYLRRNPSMYPIRVQADGMPVAFLLNGVMIKIDTPANELPYLALPNLVRIQVSVSEYQAIQTAHQYGVNP